MIKTGRLYYNYSSASPFEAGILELRPSGMEAHPAAQERSDEAAASGDSLTCVLLDKTIFYPDGGGQPSDRGTINGIQVLDVQEKDGEILHLVSAADAVQLKPGPAELILDSRRRLNLTQLHSGQHILSATILRKVGAPTVSMHLGDESATIDVNIAEISDEALIETEEIVADAIEENHPVIIHLCPPEDLSSFPLRRVPPKGEEVIRVVEIEGCDLIACCGTHVKTTAEIGMFRILGAEKYKGMTRISFLAGRRLLRECRLLRNNAGVISRALSVPLAETGKGVLEFIEKTAQTEKRLRDLEEKAIKAKAEALLHKAALLRKAADAAAPAVIMETYSDSDINELLSIGKSAQKQTRAVLILVSGTDLKFIALCSDKNFDLRTLIKKAFEARGGRGGGSPSFFQGSFATKEAMDAFLREIGSFR